MYVYKMYGRFEDITPCEYLQVQMDLSPFRLKWDENAVQVRVIEELMEEQKNSLSQVRAIL